MKIISKLIRAVAIISSVSISSIICYAQTEPVDTAWWDNVELPEIVVTSNRPKTTLRGDAMTTRISGSVLENAGNASQMLARVPMLDVKCNNVSVKGRGEAEVYINGRKVRDNRELSKLQSDRILKVEVVQNPGARYGADVKAVVRITLKKAEGEGFGFTEIGQYINQHGREWNNDLDINYRTGGFDFGAQLYFMDSSLGESMTNEQVTSLDRVWRLHSADDIQMKMRAWVPTFTFNWQLNDRHSMGVRWQWFTEPYGETVGTSTSNLICDDIPVEDNLARTGGRDSGWSHDVNIYYNGNMGVWSLDFNYDWYKEKIRDAAETYETADTVHTYSTTRNTMNSLKLIATSELWGGDFTIGSEGIFTSRRNLYLNPEGLVDDDDSKVQENIFAGFVEYMHGIGPLTLGGGLRFEHTTSDYYKCGVLQKEQSRNYSDFFPSASVTVPVGNTSLQMLYSSEIIRPSYFNLSSAVWYVNKYTYMSGNPLLKPTYTHSLSLTTAWKWLTATVGYKRIVDEEAGVSLPISPDKPQISLQTSENISPYNQGYLTLVVQPRIGVWAPSVEVSAFYQDYKAQTPQGIIKLDKPYATIDWLNVLTLPKGWRLSADMHFMSKGNMSNGELLSTSWSLDCGVLKTFLGGKLELRCDVRDIFRTKRDRLITYSGIRTSETNVTPYCNVMVTVKYSFNAAKSKFKGSGADESQRSRLK